MAEPPPRRQLSDLVMKRRKELGLGLRPLAAASADPATGKGLHFSWISDLERNTQAEAPNDREMAALARGLKLSLAELTIASAEQWGGIRAIVVPHPDKPGQVVKVILSVEGLTTDALRKVIADSLDVFRDTSATDAP